MPTAKLLRAQQSDLRATIEAIDQRGQVVDVLVSPRRDAAAILHARDAAGLW